MQIGAVPSTAPSPALKRLIQTIDSKDMPSDTAKHKDKISGRVELREAEAGYLQVWPRIESVEYSNFYRDDFYVPAHFEKSELELDYWRDVWGLRRVLIEDALRDSCTDRQPRILDVGCAGGFLLDTFRLGGWATIGVEPSKIAAAYARSRFDIDVECCTLEELDLTEPVDAVHCSLVLEHLSDPSIAIEQMSSFLRPGGVLFVECPNEFNVLQQAIRTQLKKNEWWIIPSHHLNYFSFDSLSKLLDLHGLEEIDRLATYPMELFALMGEDYIGNSVVGLDCHKKRMKFERNLIAAGSGETLNEMYRALARVGLGRTCCVLSRKPVDR